MRNLVKQAVFFTITAALLLSSPVIGEKLEIDDLVILNVKAVRGQADHDLGVITFNLTSAPPASLVLGRISATGFDSLKVMTYPEPFVESVSLVNNSRYEIKSFGVDPQADIRKMEEVCLAPLFSGGFTLKNYAGLELLKHKKLGLDEVFILRAKREDYVIKFNLDASTYLLNSMEISNNKKGLDEYKISYTFRYNEKKEGLVIPAGYYKADIGAGATARGNDQFITGFKSGVKVADNYFSSSELKFGEVAFNDNKLSGNSTISYFVPGRYGLVGTNIHGDPLKQANFQSLANVVIEIGNEKYEGKFVPTFNDITRECLNRGVLSSARVQLPHIVQSCYSVINSTR